MESKLLRHFQEASGKGEHFNAHFVAEINEQVGSFLEPESDIQGSRSIEFDSFTLFEEVAIICVPQQSMGSLNSFIVGLWNFELLDQILNFVGSPLEPAFAGKLVEFFLPVNILALEFPLFAENNIVVEFCLFMDDAASDTVDVALLVGLELSPLAPSAGQLFFLL